MSASRASFCRSSVCLALLFSVAPASPACHAQGASPPQTEPGVGGAGAPSAAAAPVRDFTDWSYDGDDSSKARVAAAHKAKDAEVEKLFSDAGVPFPPADLVLIGYKKERDVEVWAAAKGGGELKHVATYKVCYASGGLGPKRKQGDSQVPEGFYELDYYNSHSLFYLSTRVNYPNASDRKLGKKGDLGGDIMIHGNCVSIGCLAMSDERIQELWIMTKAMDDRKKRVAVYLFPTRELDTLIAGESSVELKEFWTNLKVGLDRFRKDPRRLKVRVDGKGRYGFE
ncbi:MAG: hypothetical protein FJ109_10995 [Deltaproteobacteria bacterium]|nr:hypothetical protein [Deltaproteobacteria bacterium]